MTCYVGKMGLVLAGIAVWVAPLAGQGDLIGDVRNRLAGNDFSAAETELRGYKGQRGVTPEYLEALSWMAREAVATKQWTQATGYASETRKLCEQQLTKRKLDAEPQLPLALGAAYEVLAQAMAETGQHTQAIRLLRSALVRYGSTSISLRLQKNLNLLSLVGRAAPPLQAAQYLGPKPLALAALKGSPVLCSSGRTGAGTARPRCRSSRACGKSL